MSRNCIKMAQSFQIETNEVGRSHILSDRKQGSSITSDYTKGFDIRARSPFSANGDHSDIQPKI